jgi:hypothetical protein
LTVRWIATEETVEMVENKRSEGEASRVIGKTVVTAKGTKKLARTEAEVAGV